MDVRLPHCSLRRQPSPLTPHPLFLACILLCSQNGRRRGCSCKKSGCLKLYCECFAASGRCSDRCQCVGCKNLDSNHAEITRAIQSIEKRTQRPFGSSAPVATAAGSAPDPQSLQRMLPTSSRAGATPATFPTERKAAVAMAGTSPRPVCACRDGICTSDCHCLSLFGACSPRCPCKGCTVLPQPEKTKGCSCKKSNCLKLYCECLAAQRMCDHRCNCEGCKNCQETLVERERAVAAILERNPLAFQPKVSNGSSQHLRGCNCRKSGCMKNYCECHQAGVPCTSRCACHQCRNTETFVSAKKMLVFAGVSTERDSRRSSPERSTAQRKPARRATRKSPSARNSADVQEQLLQTPTHASTRRPSALELLSRSAPTASRSYQHDDADTYVAPPTTPSKRTSSHLEQHYNTVRGTAVTPTFSRRKYTKRTSTGRLPFMDRIEEVASEAARLPDVSATVDNVYTARNIQAPMDDEPELFKLSRSLLHAAMTVECAEENEKALPSLAGQQSEQPHIEQQPEEVKAPSRSGELIDNRGALSPTAAGLFCEEDYDEAAGDDGTHHGLVPTPSNGKDVAMQPENPNHGSISSHRLDSGRLMSMSALQERAVLQEFSVWLRNIAAGSP